MKYKKQVICTFAICISIFFSGCDNENAEISDKAQEIVSIMESGDIEQISQAIFGLNDLEIDAEIEDFIADDIGEKDENGILSEIFKKDTIRMSKIKGEVIEYEIEAPNIENIFVDISNDKLELSEEELLNYMREYIENAKITKFTVLVPYTVEGKEIVVDYKNQEFINGITGGLLNGYQQFYENMLTEYMRDLEE